MHTTNLKKKYQVWVLDGLLYILHEFDTLEECHETIEKLSGYEIYHLTQKMNLEIGK